MCQKTSDTLCQADRWARVCQCMTKLCTLVLLTDGHSCDHAVRSANYIWSHVQFSVFFFGSFVYSLLWRCDSCECRTQKQKTDCSEYFFFLLRMEILGQKLEYWKKKLKVKYRSMESFIVTCMISYFMYGCSLLSFSIVNDFILFIFFSRLHSACWNVSSSFDCLASPLAIRTKLILFGIPFLELSACTVRKRR